MKKLFVSYFKTLGFVCAVFTVIGLLQYAGAAAMTAFGPGAVALAFVFGLTAAFVAFDLFVSKKFDKDLGITKDTDLSTNDDVDFDSDVGNDFLDEEHCPDCGEQECESKANIDADDAQRALDKEEFLKLKQEAFDAYWRDTRARMAAKTEAEFEAWLESGKQAMVK